MALPQIHQSREGWALFLFTIQLVLCTTGVTINETVYEHHANALATAISTGRTLAPLIVVITATTVIMVEGYDMLAERYLRRKYREGLQEGLQEGLKKGRAEGRHEGLEEGRHEGLEEGRTEANEAWQAWYQRLVAARDEGRTFDEPPPDDTGIRGNRS